MSEVKRFEIEVIFDRIQSVKDFVKAAESTAGRVTIEQPDGYIAVSGRSLMGIFSLDLSRKVLVVCDQYSAENIFNACKKLGIAA